MCKNNFLLFFALVRTITKQNYTLGTQSGEPIKAISRHQLRFTQYLLYRFDCVVQHPSPATFNYVCACSEESYVCVEHCPRSLLEVCGSDGGAAAAKHALLITLLENHEGRTVEMVST